MQIPDCMQMVDNRLHLEIDVQFSIMSETIGLIKPLTVQGFDQDCTGNWPVSWAGSRNCMVFEYCSQKMLRSSNHFGVSFLCTFFCLSVHNLHILPAYKCWIGYPVIISVFIAYGLLIPVWPN